MSDNIVSGNVAYMGDSGIVVVDAEELRLLREKVAAQDKALQIMREALGHFWNGVAEAALAAAEKAMK